MCAIIPGHLRAIRAAGGEAQRCTTDARHIWLRCWIVYAGRGGGRLAAVIAAGVAGSRENALTLRGGHHEQGILLGIDGLGEAA